MMQARPRVLLLDDEVPMLRMLEAVMTDRGYQVAGFTQPLRAMEAFAAGGFDLVVTDVKMPVMDGLEVLERVHSLEPGVPVIMISGHATVEMSIQALRRGAYDMLVKPFEPEELLSRARNALRQSELAAENRDLKTELETRFGTLIGNSPRLLAVLETARKVAARDIPVLITGESGTGKELLARAIHQHSPRSERRFVAINCGALPETLLESELFGHRKGAFTGADRDHVGLLETADRGTLFLDEIGTLPADVQSTLLRFLQDQEFYRVGESTPRRVNVRVVSATNLDLAQAIRDGGLREDLYYRLNVVNLHLPPLRERREDIPLLVAHFVRQQDERFGTSSRGFTPEAMRTLCSLEWPGNVRQLGNVVQASVAIAGDEPIGEEVLEQVLHVTQRPLSTPGSDAHGEEGMDYEAALARFECDYLARLLDRAGGNVDAAAELAGMNAATIYRKIKKYNLR
jgi:DNA-binding NtrC family response regulator